MLVLPVLVLPVLLALQEKLALLVLVLLAQLALREKLALLVLVLLVLPVLLELVVLLVLQEMRVLPVLLVQLVLLVLREKLALLVHNFSKKKILNSRTFFYLLGSTKILTASSVPDVNLSYACCTSSKLTMSSTNFNTFIFFSAIKLIQVSNSCFV